ncbi:MAG: TraR/DksA C4-type zinc finger protein [Alphaproteobacteria bacterium]
MVDVADIATEQIELNKEFSIRNFRKNLMHHKKSQKFCLECGEEIPLARRNAVAGCEYCIDCQLEIEKE